MIWTVVINGVMGFVMVITFMFCITDLDAALDTETGYPYIEVFYYATNSKAAATGMSSILIILATCCCISNLATASRQSFAFARDQGFPFSGTISKVCKASLLRQCQQRAEFPIQTGRTSLNGLMHCTNLLS